MDTTKVTKNGQVTIPVDFRRMLSIEPGNKVLFFQRENGDVVIENTVAPTRREPPDAAAAALADSSATSTATPTGALGDAAKNAAAGAAPPATTGAHGDTRAMHTHVVYCHPSESSLTAKVRDAFLRGLGDAGHTYTISDLYKMGFRADMTEQEYLRDAYYNLAPPLASDVLAEQALINAADALVFIYPVFWTDAPAKLKGWFDRVWRYGFAYGQDDARTAGLVPMRALKTVLTIATAGHTVEVLEEQGRLQSMVNVMLDDRIHTRAKAKEFVLLGGTERSDPELRARMAKRHLETAYRLALGIGAPST